MRITHHECWRGHQNSLMIINHNHNMSSSLLALPASGPPWPRPCSSLSLSLLASPGVFPRGVASIAAWASHQPVRVRRPPLRQFLAGRWLPLSCGCCVLTPIVWASSYVPTCSAMGSMRLRVPDSPLEGRGEPNHNI